MTSVALQALRCCLPAFHLPLERSDTLRAAMERPNLPDAPPPAPPPAIPTWGTVPTPSAVNRAPMRLALPPLLTLQEEIELRLDWLCESEDTQRVTEALAYLAALCDTSDAAGVRKLALAGTGTVCALLQNRCVRNDWDPEISRLADALREAVAQPQTLPPGLF